MNDSPKVQLYTTRFCGYCVAAKRLLQEREVPYQEFDLTEDAALRNEVSGRFGWTTVPIIVGDGALIGGFTELAALDRDQGLDHLK